MSGNKNTVSTVPLSPDSTLLSHIYHGVRDQIHPMALSDIYNRTTSGFDSLVGPVTVHFQCACNKMSIGISKQIKNILDNYKNIFIN